jgi:hypothetical protein
VGPGLGLQQSEVQAAASRLLHSLLMASFRTSLLILDILLLLLLTEKGELGLPAPT